MPSYASFPDNELTTLLRHGDEHAFTEIYSRYSRKLMAMAYNYAKDTTLAEEIVQQVFVSLWERRQDVTIETLGAYLATAVKFSVFKVVQRQKRQEALAREHYKPEELVHDDQLIYARFLEEYIKGITEKLPEKCRLVFHYSRDLQMSNKEIAAELELSEKTVEAHLTKAIKSIRQELKVLGLTAVLIDSVSKLF